MSEVQMAATVVAGIVLYALLAGVAYRLMFPRWGECFEDAEFTIGFESLVWPISLVVVVVGLIFIALFKVAKLTARAALEGGKDEEGTG